MMYEEFFRKRLAQLRIAKGVSARDMSLSLGQSESYINKIENGKAFPSMQIFFYICEFLSVSPEEFFSRETQYPAQLQLIMADLKSLDEKQLFHLHEFLAGFRKSENFD